MCLFVGALSCRVPLLDVPVPIVFRDRILCARARVRVRILLSACLIVCLRVCVCLCLCACAHGRVCTFKCVANWL